MNTENNLSIMQGLAQIVLPEHNSIHASRTGAIDKGNVSAANLTGELCSFCSQPISDAYYEITYDSKKRCARCSRTILKSSRSFDSLSIVLMQNMCRLFAIELPIQKISFQVSENMRLFEQGKFDVRLMGIAQRLKDGYKITIESGTPRLSAMAILVHELTHIWQFENWGSATKQQKSKKQSQPKFDVFLSEGMAMWAEVQYLLYIQEDEYAKYIIDQVADQPEEYGLGFAEFSKKYGLLKQPGMPTPFRVSYVDVL